MSVLEVRSADSCTFDAVSLGEVMLRLDPGAMRVRTARSFDVWEGGGEYNVARGLSRCFGLRTAVVTSLVDNEVGRLVEGLILAGGVSVNHVLWVPDDGVGRRARNALNFTERGFGVRGALGVSDRGHTATSQMRPDDVDWDQLFGEVGVRWLHTGGIFAGLSPTTAATAKAAMAAARRHGTVVSFDLNYRTSLWKEAGGLDGARATMTELASLVDVMLGNEEDFDSCLGVSAPDVDIHRSILPLESYGTVMERVVETYPNLSVVGTTLRGVTSASVNDWSALAWSGTTGVISGQPMPRLEIYDRVGGGDSFASGLVYGLMTGADLATSLDYGIAHGALAMTTPGDTSMATVRDVEALASGASARVQR